MKNLIRVVSLLLLAVGSSVVMALPISGNLGFGGQASVSGTTVNVTAAIVTYADGNYAADGIGFGSAVNFNPFDYAVSPYTPALALWSVNASAHGAYSFAMDSVSVGTPGTNTVLSLTGTGTVIHNGQEVSPVYWTYDGQATSGNFQVFASTVPEPSSLALLGLGLIGFGIVGYRRRRTQA